MADQRTLVYAIKVDTGEGKAKIRDFQTTIKTTETDVDKASKAVNELAKSVGEKYGVEASAAVNVNKSFSASIKDATRETNRANKNYNIAVRELERLKAGTKRTADEQERLNAIYRLGSGATLSQKKQVVALTKEYQRMRAEANKTQGSMRGLRGQAQNMGWQLQDIAVQAQAGTDSLVILGQQGSQIASGFGAVGALVGAGIAVGAAAIGVLSKTLTTAGKDVEELQEKLENLAETELLTAEQAKLLVAVETDANRERLKGLKETKKAIVAKERELEVTKSQWENVGRLSDAEVFRLKTASQVKEELNELVVQQQIYNKELDKSRERQRLYNDLVKGDTSKANKKQRDETDQLIKKLSEEYVELGLTERELLSLTLVRNNATESQAEQALTLFDLNKKHEDEIEALKEKKKAQADAAKEAEKAAKAAAKLAEEQLKVGAKYDPDIKLSLLQRQYAEERAMYIDNQDMLNKIDEHYANERIKITGSAWEQYAIQAKENLESFDEIAVESLDRFVSGFGDAFADAVFESENLGDAVSNMFKAMAKNMVAYFAEWAAQKALIWALDRTIGTATQASAATTATANAQAGSYQAGINAYQSAAAIPYVGWMIAPGAMMSALAATQPLAAAASSLSYAAVGAYDKGGFIPSGAAGIVSEYGDELVGGTMVYNGSPNSLRVTGREDTARITGGNSNINNITVNSNGNASPEAIARAVTRALKKPNKALDNAVFGATNRGKRNGGKRYA